MHEGIMCGDPTDEPLACEGFEVWLSEGSGCTVHPEEWQMIIECEEGKRVPLLHHSKTHVVFWVTFEHPGRGWVAIVYYICKGAPLPTRETILNLGEQAIIHYYMQELHPRNFREYVWRRLRRFMHAVRSIARLVLKPHP